jgi:hypothetical protein
LLHAVRRLATRHAAVPALLLAVTASHAIALPAAAAAETTSTVRSGSSALPFDMPSKDTLQGSPRKAFAHYVPSLPVSLDNADPSNDYYQRNFLRPDGEGGKHKAYGGFLRDRPATRAPRSESNWRLLDMESEVRSAIAAGLDGFTLVIYNLPDTGSARLWSNAQLLMQAAKNVDPRFKIILQPDMTGSLVNRSPEALAKYMAQLASYSSAYRVGDGRVVVSPFTAERKSVSWWKSFNATMKNTYGKPVAFLPLFQEERKWRAAFDPISYGMSNWGNRNPAGNNPTTTHSDSPLGRISAVHALGQKWMQPISVQDARPRSGIYDEAQNTQNLRNTWEIATKSGSQLVHYATWGDYPEGSVMAPTVKHGHSFLDISAYYLTKWKTGKAPTIVRDTVYLTHRTHKVAAKPSYPQTKLMALRSGSSPARDTVEALTFLKAPATVKVKVGSASYTCQADAGVDTCTVPLGPGTVSASVVRSGTTVTALTSPNKVVSTPYVQDLEYVASSSRRQGTSATSVTAATTPTAGAVTVSPLADAHADESAPGLNHGSTKTLASQGESGRTAYLRFALPAAPSGKRLVRAELRVRTTDAASAGSRDSHRVQRASNTWSESTLTWRNKPALETGTIGTLAAASGPGVVTRAVLDPAVVAQRLGQHMTLAVSASGSDMLTVWSSEHTTQEHRPALVLTFG